MQAVAQGSEGDLVDDLAGEGLLQQQAGFGLADATLAHVEEGVVVQLSHGAAVAALHVVGVDFQHRLGVHACLGGADEVGIGLLRLGLLCFLAHEDTSGKGACALLVHHIFI